MAASPAAPVRATSAAWSEPDAANAEHGQRRGGGDGGRQTGKPRRLPVRRF